MQTISQSFLSELERESINTRRMLERVPLEKGEWQPHEKSFPIAILATHIAEIPGWTELMIAADELDFSTMKYTPPVIQNSSDLLKLFDENVAKAKAQLLEADEDKYNSSWTMRHGDTVYFTMSKEQVIRTWVLNHIVHHRAQLGVYLRLLNIPVPGMYGPTADD